MCMFGLQASAASTEVESSSNEEEEKSEAPPASLPEPLQLEPAGRLAILDSMLIVLGPDGSEVSQLHLGHGCCHALCDL